MMLPPLSPVNTGSGGKGVAGGFGVNVNISDDKHLVTKALPKASATKKKHDIMVLRKRVEQPASSTHNFYVPPPPMKVDFQEMVRENNLSYVETRRQLARMQRENCNRYVRLQEVAVERQMAVTYVEDQVGRAGAFGSVLMTHKIDRMNATVRTRIDERLTAQVDRYLEEQKRIREGRGPFTPREIVAARKREEEEEQRQQQQQLAAKDLTDKDTTNPEDLTDLGLFKDTTAEEEGLEVDVIEYDDDDAVAASTPTRRGEGGQTMGGQPPGAEADGMEVLFTMRKLYVTGEYDAQQKGWTHLPDKSINTLTLQLGRLKRINMPRNNLERIVSLKTKALACTHLRGVEELNFTANKLHELPEQMGMLTNLTTLKLDNNKLSCLPPSLLKLTGLKTLDLAGNNFSELPYRFGDLRGLEHLNMGENILRHMPATTSLLVNLKYLNIEGNGMAHLGFPPMLKTDDGKDGAAHWGKRYNREMKREVWVNDLTGETSEADPTQPTSVADPGSLKEGTIFYNKRRKVLAGRGVYEWEARLNQSNGEVMYMNHVNGATVSSLPDSMNTLGHLKSLTYLNISRNKIQTLPDSISQCTQLQVLEASDNYISKLPSDFGHCKGLVKLLLANNSLYQLPGSMAACSLLEQLVLTSNRFVVFPDFVQSLASLKRLGLGNNQLQKIPYAVGFLTQLTEFQIFNNPIKDFSNEMLMQGMEAILWECRQRYFKEQRGEPPEMQVHGYGIQSEKLQLKPEFDRKMNEAVERSRTSGMFHETTVGLTSLPAGLFDEEIAGGLTSIRLDNNDLSAKPVEWYLEWEEKQDNEVKTHKVGFYKLTSLSMRDCGLKELHPSIARMSRLLTLRLEQNRIRNLPEDFTKLRSLTYLDLNENRLLNLPASFGNLVNLKRLELDGNQLEQLPADVCKMTSLEVLSLANNFIYELPSNITKLTNLKVLVLNRNDLTLMPKGFGQLSLKRLELAYNRLETLPDDFFLPHLYKTVRKLWLANNNLLELPTSMIQLVKYDNVKLESNPLISPPSHLLSEGMAVVLQYMKIRLERIEEMMDCLEAHGFDCDRTNFVPQAQSILTEDTGYLSLDDLVAFDRAVDRFLNGEFYRHSLPCEEIVKMMLSVKQQREAQFYEMIVTYMMETIEKHEANGTDFSPNVFKRKETRPWGRKGEPMRVNIITMEAVMEDAMPSVFLARPRRAIWDETLDSLPRTLFTYNKAILKKSLEHCRSPYGKVAAFEDEVYPSCECIDPETGEEVRHGKGQCKLMSLVIVKIKYSKDEAERRADEEKRIFERFKQIRDEIQKTFLHTKRGLNKLRDELQKRRAMYGMQIQMAEVKLAELKAVLSTKKELFKFAQQRKLQFEEGQAYHLHKIKDVAHAASVVANAEKVVLDIEAKIEEVTNKRVERLNRKDKAPTVVLQQEALDDLAEKYCCIAYGELLTNFRTAAVKYGWRRPWDGLDGESFIAWTQISGYMPAIRHERPENVRIYTMLRDPLQGDGFIWEGGDEDPVNRYVWDATEDMSKFKCPMFIKWRKKRQIREDRGDDGDGDSDDGGMTEAPADAGHTHKAGDVSDDDGSGDDDGGGADAKGKHKKGGRGSGDDGAKEVEDELKREQERLDAIARAEDEAEAARLQEEANAQREAAAWQITPKDRKVYKQSFVKLDKDKSGSVDFKECEPMFKKAGFSEADCRAVFAMAASVGDPPRNGKPGEALTERQFSICFHIVRRVMLHKVPFPTTLPPMLTLVS